MQIRQPREAYQRVAQRPVAGMDRYHHLNDNALIGEIVRRGIVPSRDAIDLRALDYAWRPWVLRAVLVMHDRFPKALWLPGGIYAERQVNPGRETKTLASYTRGVRRITVNATVFSKAEVKRAKARGNFHGVQNYLAGAIVHECWHCVQDAYTPGMVELVRSAWEQTTQDSRARFPLAHRDWRQRLQGAIRDYALFDHDELEAELVRSYFQGSQPILMKELLSAGDYLFGPEGIERPITERPEAWGFEFGWAPTLVAVEADVVGYIDPFRMGVEDDHVRYLEAEGGRLFRIAGGTIIDVTRSFDEGAIVAHEVPQDLQRSLRCTAGEPLWFKRTRRVDAALPESFATARVEQVVEVSPSFMQADPGNVAERTAGRRTDLVRRTEQLLSAIDPNYEGRCLDDVELDPHGSVVVQELVDQGARARLARPISGRFHMEDFLNRPYGRGVVALDAEGNQLVMGRPAYTSTVALAYTHGAGDGDRRGVVHDVVDVWGCQSITEGDVLSFTAESGTQVSFGPVTEVYVAEVLPVSYEHLRPLERRTSQPTVPTRSPIAASAADAFAQR